MSRFDLLASTSLLLIVGGCASSQTYPGRVTQSIQSPEAMKATLASQLIGKPVAEAQKFMEQEEFTCSLLRQSSFQHGSDGERDVRHGIDYLHCRRDDPMPNSWLVGRVWLLALVIENGVVTDVMGRSYGLGP